MEEIIDYINKLKANQFSNWEEDQKIGYLTACLTIENFIKKEMKNKKGKKG